jgi:hypothetical protein
MDDPIPVGFVAGASARFRSASFAGKYDGRVDDLIAFLAARLDEDEHFAKIARLAQKHREQMLREVAFKRAILAQWEHSPAGSPVLTNVLYQLTAVYSDHPDYRPEWKP